MPPAKGKGAKKVTSSLKPVDDKKVGKRKAASKPVGKKEVAKKDPNKPKRPPSAFFIFLEDFRKTFKKENPNVKAVSAVGKAGGEKWKSMSQAEKAPYEAKAAKRKTEYGKLMDTYNKKQEADEEEEEEEEEEKEKEKSKPEVHHDDDESAEDEDDDEEDDDDDEDED